MLTVLLRLWEQFVYVGNGGGGGGGGLPLVRMSLAMVSNGTQVIGQINPSRLGLMTNDVAQVSGRCQIIQDLRKMNQAHKQTT